MLEVTGQSGIFRASTLDGKTVMNAPWQLSGSRTAFAGTADITVDCTSGSDNCVEMKRSLIAKPDGATLAVKITLAASDPSWCYAPFYKSGELTYDATVEVAVKGTAEAKRIGMQGHVEASGFGVESCGFVRKFLVFLATRDVLRQLNDGARKGRELMWKCADGKLHGTQDDRDPCAMR